jgi:hypothetical protein
VKGTSEHKYCGLPTARVTPTSNLKSNVPPWNLPISPSARSAIPYEPLFFRLLLTRSRLGRHAYLPWHKNNPRPNGPQSRGVFLFNSLTLFSRLRMVLYRKTSGF